MSEPKTTSETDDRPLTARQQRFVDEYLVDCNGTQAAVRAGFSPRSAAEQAARLLTDVKIARAVAAGKAAIAERNRVKVDDIIAEYVRIAFSDVRNYHLDLKTGNLLVPDSVDPAVWRAVSSLKRKAKIAPDGGMEIDVEVRLWDKLNALEKLGKHLGLFQERPAIEVLLALLPVEVAGPLRDALARHLAANPGAVVGAAPLAGASGSQEVQEVAE